MFEFNGKDLVKSSAALIDGERHPIANAANIASLIYNTYEEINWAGFYFLSAGELVLGPFSGKPACVRIKRGQGVCGVCVETGKSMIVDDVVNFPGHIACDSESRSELVVPIFNSGELIGVIDLDSPHPSRWTDTEKNEIELVADIFANGSDFDSPGFMY